MWGIGGGAGRQGGEGERGQAAAHQSLPGARQGGPGKDSGNQGEPGNDCL